jgi:hypothetical protein
MLNGIDDGGVKMRRPTPMNPIAAITPVIDKKQQGHRCMLVATAGTEQAIRHRDDLLSQTELNPPHLSIPREGNKGIRKLSRRLIVEYSAYFGECQMILQNSVFSLFRCCFV